MKPSEQRERDRTQPERCAQRLEHVSTLIFPPFFFCAAPGVRVCVCGLSNLKKHNFLRRPSPLPACGHRATRYDRNRCFENKMELASHREPVPGKGSAKASTKPKGSRYLKECQAMARLAPIRKTGRPQRESHEARFSDKTKSICSLSRPFGASKSKNNAQSEQQEDEGTKRMR